MDIYVLLDSGCNLAEDIGDSCKNLPIFELYLMVLGHVEMIKLVCMLVVDDGYNGYESVGRGGSIHEFYLFLFLFLSLQLLFEFLLIVLIRLLEVGIKVVIIPTC